MSVIYDEVNDDKPSDSIEFLGVNFWDVDAEVDRWSRSHANQPTLADLVKEIKLSNEFAKVNVSSLKRFLSEIEYNISERFRYYQSRQR